MLSKPILFEKLHNIRDLGGMRTTEGRAIKSNCFIRSGHLEDLSEADKEKMKGLVGTVIDFRTDGERNEKPDVVIAGISYVHMPVMESLTMGITREEKADREAVAKLALQPEEAKKYMCLMYKAVAGDSATAQYAGFVRMMLDKKDKGFLWHCTAGKDRAGIASAIVEEILGVSREDIIADYLSTNKHLEKDIAFLTGYVKEKLGTDSNLADEALRYLFGAEEDYILTYYEAVESRFGSFEAFIKEGLGLSNEQIETLRDMYLE